jgi:hypothetical protein
MCFLLLLFALVPCFGAILLWCQARYYFWCQARYYFFGARHVIIIIIRHVIILARYYFCFGASCFGARHVIILRNLSRWEFAGSKKTVIFLRCGRSGSL